MIYPNITHKIIQRDSYIDLLPSIIEYLNKLRSDIHFTLILPQFIKTLDFPNVEQVFLSFPNNANRMRTHFDSDKIKAIIDSKNKDWDILYSQLPEHTLQLTNLFYNSTNIHPKIIGYCHWFETNESMSNRERNMFLQNISGILQMQECGVNSNWLKNFVLKKATEFFNEQTIEKLSTIIQPHYLGIDKIKKSTNFLSEPKLLLFNHRHNSYTGYKWLIGCLDKLWEQRKDFKLIVTHTDLKREYSEKFSASKSEYMDNFDNIYLGIGAFKNYSSWSISVTDGFSRGVPYLLPNDLVYGEMIGEDYPLFYDNNEEAFLNKINAVLDDPKLRENAVKNIKPKMKDFLWDQRVSKWFGNWKTLFTAKDYKCIKPQSESYKKVIQYIRQNKCASKKDLITMLGWGQTFGFSSIRNQLRCDKRIKLTENEYIWK